MNFTGGLRGNSIHDDTPKTHRHANATEQSQYARLVSLAPHRVLLETSNSDGELKRLILPPAEEVPRLVIAPGQEAPILIRTEGKSTEEIAIPVMKGTRASRAGSPLPAPQPEIPYIIGRALAEYLPGRSDLVQPEDQIRDVNGNVIGMRKLGRVSDRASTS